MRPFEQYARPATDRVADDTQGEGDRYSAILDGDSGDDGDDGDEDGNDSDRGDADDCKPTSKFTSCDLDDREIEEEMDE